MGIPGDIGYLCDFHTRDDNALSMLGSKINDANVLQNTKNQNSVYAMGVDDFKMSNMMLRPTTLLSEHTTGVLFDNGLYNYASLNNDRRPRNRHRRPVENRNRTVARARSDIVLSQRALYPS